MWPFWSFVAQSEKHKTPAHLLKQTQHVNPGEKRNPWLIPPVKSAWICKTKVERKLKEASSAVIEGSGYVCVYICVCVLGLCWVVSPESGIEAWVVGWVRRAPEVGGPRGHTTPLTDVWSHVYVYVDDVYADPVDEQKEADMRRTAKEGLQYHTSLLLLIMPWHSLCRYSMNTFGQKHKDVFTLVQETKTCGYWENKRHELICCGSVELGGQHLQLTGFLLLDFGCFLVRVSLKSKACWTSQSHGWGWFSVRAVMGSWPLQGISYPPKSCWF